MSVGKITISSISKLEGYLWDTVVVGFGARRQRNLVHYYVRYRINGTQVVRSLGRHGALTPDTARARARQLLGVVSGGVDPFARSSGETFGVVVHRYLERKRASLKPTSFTNTDLYLRKHFSALHGLRLDQIDRRKVAGLLGEIETTSGAVSRNRARSTLSAFFAWAIQEGLIDGANPVAGTGKADEGGSRERVLSPDELKTLWRGLDDGAFSQIVRLLLLTGARRNEVGKMSWPEVNLADRVINLPAHRVKNGRDHTIPLSTQAHAILSGLPRRNSTEFVFGGRGFNHWDAAKKDLDQRVGIADWHLHDLRRSAATYMAEIGVLPHIVEACLNHQSGHKSGIAGTYNRALYEVDKRSALQRYGDWLDKITG
jgi:integrase